MNARELRIGNYVSVKEKELKSFLDDYGLHGIENSFEVVSIDNVHLNILIDGLEVEYYLSDLQPIPLTEEWLVKLKMEHNESLTKGNGTYWFTLITPHTPITYVHQLQNLYFALTGKELRIKNNKIEPVKIAISVFEPYKKGDSKIKSVVKIIETP
jgi:hypothetical protein